MAPSVSSPPLLSSPHQDTLVLVNSGFKRNAALLWFSAGPVIRAGACCLSVSLWSGRGSLQRPVRSAHLCKVTRSRFLTDEPPSAFSYMQPCERHRRFARLKNNKSRLLRGRPEIYVAVLTLFISPLMTYWPILASSADFDPVWMNADVHFYRGSASGSSSDCQHWQQYQIISVKSNIRLSFKTKISAVLSQYSSVANERPWKRLYLTARFKTFAYCYNIVFTQNMMYILFLTLILLFWTLCFLLVHNLHCSVVSLRVPLRACGWAALFVWKNWATAGKVIPQFKL